MAKKRGTNSRRSTIPVNSYQPIRSQRAVAIARAGQPVFICDPDLNANDPASGAAIMEVDLVWWEELARSARQASNPLAVVGPDGNLIDMRAVFSGTGTSWDRAVTWAREQYQVQTACPGLPMFYIRDEAKFTADHNYGLQCQAGTWTTPSQPRRLQLAGVS